MKVTRLLLTGLLVAVLTSLTASAAPPTGPRAAGRTYRAALRHADLTEQQRAEVRSLAEAARPALAELRDRQRADRQALRAAAEAAGADPKAVGEAFLRLKTDREALHGELRRLHGATLALMTPEQRGRFEGFMAAVREARRERAARR